MKRVTVWVDDSDIRKRGKARESSEWDSGATYWRRGKSPNEWVSWSSRWLIRILLTAMFCCSDDVGMWVNCCAFLGLGNKHTEADWRASHSNKIRLIHDISLLICLVSSLIMVKHDSCADESRDAYGGSGRCTRQSRTHGKHLHKSAVRKRQVCTNAHIDCTYLFICST